MFSACIRVENNYLHSRLIRFSTYAVDNDVKVYFLKIYRDNMFNKSTYFYLETHIVHSDLKQCIKTF